MRFKSGMLGICIVIVSLLISVLAGFVMDVEKGQREATDYEYITDVTGLFNIGQAPDYITYNPSSNYVGYSAGSVNYTEASSVNSYRFIKTPGSTTTTGKTFTKDNTPLDARAYPDPNVTDSEGYYNRSIQTLLNVSNYPGFGSPITWEDWTYNVAWTLARNNTSGISTLSAMLNTMSLSGITAHIDVYNTGNPYFFYPHSSLNYTTFTGGNGIDYFIFSKNINWATQSVTAFDVDLTTYTVTAYHGNTTLWTDTASNVDVLYRYNYTPSGGGSTQSDGASVYFNATITHPPIYGYADPSAGVTLANSPTTWSNDYNNSEILLTVSRNTSAYNNLTITAGGSWITVNISNVGAMTVNINGASGSDSKNMGLWDSAQIRLNLGAGSVSVTPIVGAPDYMAPVSENSSTVTWYNWYNGGDLASLTFSSVGASLRWGITETRVFLNTYNAVMNNPSIDITQHFPDLEGWRLNFYSFATVGDSITINNKTFAIGPNQTITVTNDEDDSITGQLTDIVVSKDLDGVIWFGFRNGSNISLGPAVSNVISFSGMWYFTTGLYEAVQTFVSYYDWNLDGVWHANGGQIIIIFLGCILGAVVVCKGLMKIPIKGMDGLVLASAVIFMLIIGGSLI